MSDLIDNWIVTPGQCLLCGGRGGYPGGISGTVLCTRCDGTGRDPARGEGWYMDHVLPVQRAGLPDAPLCGSWPLGWNEGDPVSCVLPLGHEEDFCRSKLDGQWRRVPERTPDHL